MAHLRLVAILLVAGPAVACATVEPGERIIPPELRLDEDFFYCRIQPEVITSYSCASGPGMSGGCHSVRSALRLTPLAESDPPPTCDGNVLTGAVPDSYEDNFIAVQGSVQSDSLSSPFHRRPTGEDGHDLIFPATSPEAMLIAEWIDAGAM